MCDDHGTSLDDARPGHALSLSRRGLLKGMAVLAAAGALPGYRPGVARAAARLGPRVGGVDGLTSYVMAMHLHASASEGVRSLRSQVTQAALNGFDVAWFTEHDWRRRQLLFRPEYHFLTGETSPVGGTWSLTALANIGSLTASSGAQQVSTPTSLNDQAAKKASLRLNATSTGTAMGTVRRRINADKSRQNFRGRIAGHTLSVEVLPTQGGPDAWGEVLLTLSHHPGSGTRPTGVCSVLYRLRTDLTTGAIGSQGTTAIVDVPVTKGIWQTVTFDPVGDLAPLWPDLDHRDNTLNQIDFRASSRQKAPVEVYFCFLRFQSQAGFDAIGVESALLDRYRLEVPGVLGLLGTELSLGPHLNQFGGTTADYDYGVTSLNQKPTATTTSLAAFIHANGGLASINHPFKPGDSGGGGTASTVAANLLATQAGGADILEVGYLSRDGVDLSQYLAVWDTLSRNGLFLTGNGASDDHSGQGWASLKNRFYTGAWATILDQQPLIDALAAGRAFVGYLGKFAGTIDMTVDDTMPMGKVGLGALGPHTLHLRVTGVPTGGSVQILQGHVDYAGAGNATPNTSVVQTLGAAAVGGPVDVPLDATDPSFFRVQVLDGSGAVVGLGQPTWLLDVAPSTGIPTARTVPAPAG